MDIDICCENIFMARGLREGLPLIYLNRHPGLKLNIVVIPGDSLSHIRWMAGFCIRRLKEPTVLLGTEMQLRIMKGLVDPVYVQLLNSQVSMQTLWHESIWFSQGFYQRNGNVSAEKVMHSLPESLYRNLELLETLFNKDGTMTKYESAQKNRVRNFLGVHSTCEMFVKYQVIREMTEMQERVRQREARRQKVGRDVKFFLSDNFFAA
ncbi:MAG TPA: hypothetical protein VGL07_13265 [Buttiauxella sp.]|jgi:hypothetical protein